VLAVRIATAQQPFKEQPLALSTLGKYNRCELVSRNISSVSYHYHLAQALSLLGEIDNTVLIMYKPRQRQVRFV